MEEVVTIRTRCAPTRTGFVDDREKNLEQSTQNHRGEFEDAEMREKIEELVHEEM